MRPSALYEQLATDADLLVLGIGPSRIKDHESVDTRPFDSGYFIIVRMHEFSYKPSVERGPRNIEIRVHTPWDRTRKFDKIEQILKRVDDIFKEVEQVTGADGLTISQIRKTGQSENLRDEGWETIAQFCTYHVLYG